RSRATSNAATIPTRGSCGWTTASGPVYCAPSSVARRAVRPPLTRSRLLVGEIIKRSLKLLRRRLRLLGAPLPCRLLVLALLALADEFGPQLTLPTAHASPNLLPPSAQRPMWHERGDHANRQLVRFQRDCYGRAAPGNRWHDPVRPHQGPEHRLYRGDGGRHRSQGSAGGRQ